MDVMNGSEAAASGTGKVRSGAGLKPMLVPANLLTIYRRLKLAAEHELPCPTNNELADAIGAESTATVSRQIALLETLGLITVVRYRAARHVTIAETGQSTALPKGRPVDFSGHKRTRQVPAPHDRHDIDRFCEALSESGSISGAARAIGIKEKVGYAIFAQVKAEMGAQAQ